jgi:hypothetical protein
VVDDELFAAFEEVDEFEGSVGSGEGVVFVDFDMRQGADFFRESVAGFGVFFLFFEEEFAGCYPFVVCGALGIVSFRPVIDKKGLWLP